MNAVFSVIEESKKRKISQKPQSLSLLRTKSTAYKKEFPSENKSSHESNLPAEERNCSHKVKPSNQGWRTKHTLGEINSSNNRYLPHATERMMLPLKNKVVFLTPCTICLQNSIANCWCAKRWDTEAELSHYQDTHTVKGCLEGDTEIPFKIDSPHEFTQLGMF